VPNVISGWNKEELLKQASPELLGVTKDEDLDKLFTMFRKLGKLKKYKGSEGQSLISVTTEQGKKVTANYTAMAEFERGEASIKVNLIKHGDEWQILMFNVSSDIFLNL
jgi:D-Tyr-tRNAtyr deacylase